MKRARAVALVLVNWKGVFYQRYLLDERVTALEGENGAGKTTVLIAGYVVLMPDMTRLRFTNVGESGAAGDDRGLWGRLGGGAPSYAALEFALPQGERLVAGVQLIRRVKPKVELNSFIASGIRPDVTPQDVFLERGDRDRVPDMAALRENVAKAGGILDECASAKDYFATLFERGVMPLRLAADDERIKFNEMLRSSMAGGISRKLSDELRQFLLKEETGLADTLARMRTNLEACRRTRTEVDEAARLEEEIHSVYESGEEMFAAALLATRERAAELKRRRDEAREAFSTAEETERTRKNDVDTATSLLDPAKRRLDEARGAVETARAHRVAVEQAHRIAQRIAISEGELVTADASLDTATAGRVECERIRDIRKSERDRARVAYDAAADGLATFQDGVQLLARRAGEHRLVIQRLEEVRAVLAPEPVLPDDFSRHREGIAERKLALRRDLTRLHGVVETAEARAADFKEALDALERIEGAAVVPAAAHATAERALAQLREADELLRSRSDIEADRERSQKFARAQERARTQAELLGVPRGDGPSWSEFVSRTWRELEDAVRGGEQREAKALAAAVEARGLAVREGGRVKLLEAESAQWQDLRERSETLAASWARPASRRPELVEMREWLLSEKTRLSLEIANTQRERAALQERIGALEQSGGSPDIRLNKAKELIDGELVPDQLDELPIERAGQIEALLGPLAHAILVDDARSAATVLAGSEARPDSVWLVERGAAAGLLRDPVGEAIEGSVFVTSAHGSRLTRVPERPFLGRVAREQRIVELRDEARQLSEAVERADENGNRVDAALSETGALLDSCELLEREDVAGELKQARAAFRTAEADADLQSEAAGSERTWVEKLKPRASGLRDLLAEAWLLDEADFAARVADLEARLRAAAVAEMRLREVGRFRIVVRDHLDVLRSPPLAESELRDLRGRLESMTSQFETALSSLDALDFVIEHRAALDWVDAEPALREKEELAPALRDQLARAKGDSARAEDGLTAQETAVDGARRVESDAYSSCSSLRASLERARDELSQTQILDASAEAVTGAHVEEASRTVEAEVAEADHVTADRALVQATLLLQQARTDLEDKKSKAEAEERLWGPQQAKWEQLQSAASEKGLLAAAMGAGYLGRFEGKGSISVWAFATAGAKAVLVQLRRAKDGETLALEIEQSLGAEEQSLSDALFAAWLSVRIWLRRRVPPQISEEPEPLTALERLREHLRDLQARLKRQEDDLRGESQSVGHNIDIHVRRAKRQITALSERLSRVQFGSIRSVKIDVKPVDRMTRILEALRSGQAQELLFDSPMPIEEALNALFERHAGGKSGGQKLLDYREYLELRVQVLRQASEDWELASAVEMSTGEAIGVGAALMMVILAEWEKDANLLRGKRAYGSLRLLFLDEATRLSPGSLTVLFELCESLDLQLVIAAPEVPQERGNTTYRLVRRVDADGHAEVLASGRRLRVPPAS